jgi:hypothetical protein
MKVTRNTPDQLIIADTPWLISIALTCFILIFVAAGLLAASEEPWFGFPFATIGAGIGAVAFWAFVRRVQVIIDRPANTLTIRRQSILGYQSVTHALSDLSRAVVETSVSNNRSSGSRTPMNRATLIFDTGMSAGAHPITEVYTSGQGASRAARAINTWLGPQHNS